ncbi:hypothetical protein ACLOJK_028239 [Asimina triloba]
MGYPSSLVGAEHIVHTGRGPISVSVFGDQEKPALITYPDLALNQFLQLGAAEISSDLRVPSADDLADQVADVLDYFRLHVVMCFGVTGGAYILTLFAVVSNLLYFYGMCGLVKECLLQRYFSKGVRGNDLVPESDIVQACRSSGVRFYGYRGATACNAHTDGVLPDGIWVVSAMPAEQQPTESVEPLMHLSGVALTGKYGFEAEANKDEDFIAGLTDDSAQIGRRDEKRHRERTGRS